METHPRRVGTESITRARIVAAARETVFTRAAVSETHRGDDEGVLPMETVHDESVVAIPKLKRVRLTDPDAGPLKETMLEESLPWIGRAMIRELR